MDPAQPVNDALSCKGLFEHMLVLFLKGGMEKDRVTRLDHAK